MLKQTKELAITASHILKGWLYTHIWYPRIKTRFNKTVVAVVDGRLYTGGMTDRFIGIISLYALAKTYNIPFRIKYTSPFNLTDYLLPNKYNWIPSEGDYIESSLTSKVVYAVGEPRFDKRLRNLIGIKQIHFYGNRDLLCFAEFQQFDWGKLFKELFRPADSLQEKLNTLRKEIGQGEYVSIVFRFQNLLGDFKEYNFKPLSEHNAREKYIEKCIGAIRDIHAKENKPCLITSDSVLFLNRLRNLTYVYIIPGNLVHMGSEDTGTYSQYEKSFLDFYGLAASNKIYNIVYGNMYPSGFPLYASKINSIPFERIILR